MILQNISGHLNRIYLCVVSEQSNGLSCLWVPQRSFDHHSVQTAPTS